MDESLLATKLFIPPPRSDIVERRRLIERLDEGLRLGRRMTLVSSAAGSGKSTLVSAWIAGVQRVSTWKAVWLSLDAEDNDPARFWTYAAAALRATGAGTEAKEPKEPGRSFLTSLLNEAATFRESVILVLEDYHVIAEPIVHEGVAFLLDRLPRQLHLVVCTRADPPLPVARLRARGQLTELREADLRFTSAEAVSFLNGVMKLGLEPEEVAALEARTEGWIAGLNLAALSLRGCRDVRGFIEAFAGSHRYVLDYLMEEVLNVQTRAVQRFLVRTSILDRFCAPLCDAVTGERDGAEMVERLRRDNLFIVPLDGERRWYRYHHLFGDLLRKRLGESVPLHEIREMHGRAGKWHEERGFLEEAVVHARAAGATEEIARLAERAASLGLLDARLTTLLRWVDELPPEPLAAHPRLCIYRAWALYMNGHPESAVRAFKDSRVALENLPPSPENDALRPELTRLMDCIDMIARGFMLCLDNGLSTAIRLCGRARDMALEDGRIFLAVQATEGIALSRYYQGRLRESARSCRNVIEMAEGSASDGPLAAAGYVELAGIYTEWNDLAGASALLDKAFAICRQWGAVQTLKEAYVARSRLLLAGGDLQGARETLKRAGDAGSMEGERSLANFRLFAQRAILDLRCGKTEKVVSWVTDTMAAHAAGGHGRRTPAFFIEALRTTLARAYLARARAKDALAALDSLLEPSGSAGGLRVIEVGALKALALSAMGDAASALASLERSLALSAPERFVRTYLNEGPPMERLLRQAASRGIVPEYAGVLLAAFGGKATGAIGLPEPLSPRELEVLRLIDDGLSNKEIAGRLFVALNTVKRHTAAIYGKLGVKSRTMAVARARGLGLLG